MSSESFLPENFAHYLRYWRDLEPQAKIPHLSRLLDKPDPLIHPWLNIVDVVTEASQPVRFAGTRLVSYFGKDLTGSNFLEILSAQARPIIQWAHREIIARPCGTYHQAICSTQSGREFELLAMGLPLRRSEEASSVAWLLEPHKTVNYGELHVLVQKVDRWTWLDLGSGIPTAQLS